MKDLVGLRTLESIIFSINQKQLKKNFQTGSIHRVQSKLNLSIPMSISDTDCIDGKNLLWECNLKELKKDIGKYLSYPKNRKEALKQFNNYFVKDSSRMHPLYFVK